MGRTPTTLTDPRTSMSVCLSGEPAIGPERTKALTSGIDGPSVSLLDLAFRGLAAGEEGEGEAPVLVTLGKRCGPVTWRLMAPKPPF